ncbi:MAG: glycosyl hydrolase, partial [Eudoraea sp.]|nr:glycosyl hydrolase [Eudoraea sp.]
NWEPFQLNLPVTPITDLKVHQGDLIVATSGRSFWVLDDLQALAQYAPGSTDLSIMQPEVTHNGNWGSPLSGNSTKLKGTHPFQGVNPANGMVLYYQLPELNSDTALTLTIKDAQGKVVRTFSAEKDPDYKPHNGGGAPPKPVLSKKKGLNRFVWNLGYPIMPGIPDVYIEANFRGHKAPPGTYTLELAAGNKTVSTTGEIREMPGFETKPGQYEAYDKFMSALESNLTQMHNTINSLYHVQAQLEAILSDMESGSLKTQGDALLDKLKTWDEEMVQRKSKAYDDVENFPNKFSAEYLFLINQTNSAIPRVNKSSQDRRAELDKQWAVLKAKAATLIQNDIIAFNKALWEAGIGAIRIPK